MSKTLYASFEGFTIESVDLEDSMRNLVWKSGNHYEGQKSHLKIVSWRLEALVCQLGNEVGHQLLNSVDFLIHLPHLNVHISLRGEITISLKTRTG